MKKAANKKPSWVDLAVDLFKATGCAKIAIFQNEDDQDALIIRKSKLPPKKKSAK